MGLTKRKDGYYVEFPVVDDGKVLTLASGIPGAKVKRWKTSTHNRTMAKKQEAKIKTDLMMGKIPSDCIQSTRITFANWAKEYVKIEEVKILRSYRERCQRIETELVPHFGKMLLEDIKAKDVEEFRQKRGKNRALSTVNVDHNTLKHMLKHAMKRDLVPRNAATLVAAPKPKNRRNRILTPEEWERLYDAAFEWFKPVLLTGYHTGMRLEEILTLTWDRVDFENGREGRIFLPGSLTKNGQDRSVPLTSVLRKELLRLRGVGGVVRIQGLVFQRDGRKITHTYRLVQQLCKEQNIPNFVFHDLRHCAVTNLRNAGVEVEVIMEIVGHSSVDMFLRYNKVAPEKLDTAMSRLNTLITLPQIASSQVTESITL